MDEPFEVLVGMEEGTPLAAAIQRRFPLVRLCPVPPDAGPGGARNAAIPLARGEYLAFTDADDLPERTWLRDMVRLVERNDGRPVRGWVTMHHQFSCVARACRCAEEGIVRPRRALVAPGLSGANMAMASRLLADPARRFTDRLYGAEEIELLANLPAQDRVVLLSPRPEVHEMRYDLWGQSLRRMYKLGYGSGHLRRRRRLRGSTMARWPVLAPLLVPGRYLLTARRVLACGAAAMLDFLRLTPIILCMLVSYTAGFVRGAKDARCAGRTEDGP
jgi:glycosyltransferase involved in cell wall biosynthesis